MKPHKHAEIIKAWAGGAQIEMKTKTGHWLQTYPLWDEEIEYRIKPEVKKTVVRWKCAYKREDGRFLEVEHFYTQEEITKEKSYIKLEYTRQEFPE